MRKLGVVYLARSADGTDAFERFASSYRQHDAGVEHDLIVLYKGFANLFDRDRARSIFGAIDHLTIELEDNGFDIGSYVEASRRLEHESLCFLNTHSEILAERWLSILNTHHSRAGVGLVGPMGSYESIADSVPLMERAIRTAQHPGARVPATLPHYFDFLLPRFRPDWYGGAAEPKPDSRGFRGLLMDLSAIRARARDRRQGPRGTALIWQGAPELDIEAFPHFPNPHLRSNGFMISRERFLQSDLTVMQTKADANLFESGSNSLTAQIRRSGLAVVVAGRDGRAYDIPDWPRSSAFRLADQANLLLGDNHTRAFATMSASARVTHARMTWGDYLGSVPPDFPDFGIAFSRGPTVAPTAGRDLA
jgi:hypothetical protein